MIKPFIERFWSKVDIKNDDECWLWKEARDDNSHYGVFWDFVQKRTRRAHVVAYEIFTGDKVEADFIVMHLCDNPPCCNPHHLIKGTKKENTHDMVSKGRGGTPPLIRGENHPKAKLTENNVREIRELIKSGLSQKKIARIFGVNRGTISCIYSKRNWKWLT
jgi:hypothetical protein